MTLYFESKCVNHHGPRLSLECKTTYLRAPCSAPNLSAKRGHMVNNNANGWGGGKAVETAAAVSGVPASESDRWRSVRLEPRLIRLLAVAAACGGGRSGAAAFGVVVVSRPSGPPPALANEDESDLEMVRREPTISIGNAAVSLILLLDKKPPPPPPPPPFPPVGASMRRVSGRVGTSGRRRLLRALFGCVYGRDRAHTRARRTLHTTRSHFGRETFTVSATRSSCRSCPDVCGPERPDRATSAECGWREKESERDGRKKQKHCENETTAVERQRTRAKQTRKTHRTVGGPLSHAVPADTAFQLSRRARVYTARCGGRR